MGLPSIVMLAVGLAMDAAAVSAAKGLALPAIRARHAVLVALFFGGFQALMPLLGWLIGTRVGPLVEQWAHWIAFTLLCAIGGKMLWEARAADGDSAAGTSATTDPMAPGGMLVLAVATSVDALAVGVTLPMLNAPLVLSVLIIGVTTALLSIAGLFAGRKFGALLGRRLDAVGGLVLVGLGVKILLTG